MNPATAGDILEPGRRIGPYEVQSKIGDGGMGQVYRALDRRLNRVVALKVLTGDSSGAALREAQAASALNHPNIVTVYEVGVDGAIEFIAMEFVEGDTIARRGSRMSIREGLRYGVQIADALAAAHAEGIIHRDLKPGNIMVTSRGLVKVLDFGIAKVTSPTAASSDAATWTITQPGRVIGTFAYMSPEQAEGREVDSRSDIFSFGCLLYELMTGHRAFAGDSSMGTLAAVMVSEPHPLRELSPDLPSPVIRIIENCLRKKREERWQSMGDVKLLLEAALTDPSTAPAPAPRRSLALALLPVALVTGALVAWAFLRHAPPAVTEHARILNRATLGAGLSLAPSLSADGHFLAWASDRSSDGNLDIWVQQVGSSDPVRLTHDPADDTDPSIAPDGSRIAFRSERSGGAVYLVPTMGGEPALFAPRGRNPRYSPNGHWIAYWEGRQSGGLLPGSAKVLVLAAGGGQARQLGADLAAALYPVWSPDSNSLLVLGRGNKDTDSDWWILPLDGSPARPTGAMAALRKQNINRVAWQRQIPPLVWRPTGVLFTANLRDAGNLWELPLPPGTAVSITRGPGYHLQASTAADGALAFSDLEWKNEVWSLPVDAERGTVRGELQKLTADEADAMSPSSLRDGSRMVYRGRYLDRFAVRSRDMSTGRQLTLVEGIEPFNPRIGEDAVVYCDADGNIYRVSPHGGPAEKVCPVCGFTSGISPDGTRVAYQPAGGNDIEVLDLRTLAKSHPVAAINAILTAVQYSPDGKWIAFDARSFQSTAQVFVTPAASAVPLPQARWIPITPGASEDIEPAWSPGGSLLYFLSDRDGFRCIWARPLDPATKVPKGEAFAVQHFHSARRSLRRILGNGGFPGLHAVPGRLIFSFGELTGNVWLER